MNISFIIKTIGIENNLQYWESILNNVSEVYGKVTLYTKTKHQSTQNIKINVLDNNLNLLNKDSFILKIVNNKIDICFTNEFNFWSFLVVIVCRFSKKSKSILLVENDSKFLKGYGINKSSFFDIIWRKTIANLATVIVTNNEFGKDYLTNNLLISNNKIIATPYLVSSLPQKTIIKKSVNDRIKFLFVGQISKRKGLEQLVLAINSISNYFSENAELHIVGKGELANKIKLDFNTKVLPYIYFHGFVPYSEISKHYQSCDVFIWPTLADYRALVGFEAISSGLPLIFSKYDGACEEVVSVNENGFIIDPYNYSDIAEKIKWFIEHKENILDMSKCSYERSKRFSICISKLTLLNAINYCK